MSGADLQVGSGDVDVVLRVVILRMLVTIMLSQKSALEAIA
jgi:hypothetical protein